MIFDCGLRIEDDPPVKLQPGVAGNGRGSIEGLVRADAETEGDGNASPPEVPEQDQGPAQAGIAGPQAAQPKVRIEGEPWPACGSSIGIERAPRSRSGSRAVEAVEELRQTQAGQNNRHERQLHADGQEVANIGDRVEVSQART